MVLVVLLGWAGLRWALRYRDRLGLTGLGSAHIRPVFFSRPVFVSRPVFCSVPYLFSSRFRFPVPSSVPVPFSFPLLAGGSLERSSALFSFPNCTRSSSWRGTTAGRS